jgi:L-asparaginase|tara:strand:- start:58132 stop:59190 length:1059 start_codon:yes stop_codon:yes gene_type:complete
MTTADFMTPRRLVAAISIAACSLAYGIQANAAEHPGVKIYATGGTIAGSSASSTDTTNYKSGSLGVQALLDAVPELADVAEVTGEQIANTGSSNIDQEILLKLSKAINEELATDATHGVVITHGTDTLEETGFFLDLTVDSDKPVVMVGAMRPATAISADGPFNLLEAVTLAADEGAEGRGAMIVLNDRIGSAYYTTKTNAIMMDTFKATEQGYLGAFISGKPHFYYTPATPTDKPRFDVTSLDGLPKVDIIYAHQDMDPALFTAALDNGAKGIVIAGSGNGSIPETVKPLVKQAMADGIPVVRSTRTGNGIVSAKEEGIGSGALNPQKARILLSLALTETDDMDKVRGYFE